MGIRTVSDPDAPSGSLAGTRPRTSSPVRGLGLACALGVAALAGACVSATPYREAAKAGRDGYSDTRIETNRFRVTFEGNSSTPRDTVENYLLYRAAELTLQNGDDYFVMATRDTESQSRLIGNSLGSGFGSFGGFGGFGSSRFFRYSFHHPRFFGFHDPFFFDSFSVNEITKYQAQAEFQTGKGPKPADNPSAFDARDVERNLATRIVRTAQR